MLTTIQVDSQTKEKLLCLKLKLSEIEGWDISYNEILNRLLENSTLIMKLRSRNRLSMRKYCGTLPKNALHEWQNEKHHDFV